MVRLHFVVEGQTEETFIRNILTPELAAQGIYCDTHRVTTGRKGGKIYRGGLLSYRHLRKDLDLWMKQDQNIESWFTTMIDLYRLPADFPGVSGCANLSDPIIKVEKLESKFGSDLSHLRFIPYIQLHEFESLLFSDPQSFSHAFPGINNKVLQDLETIRNKFGTPEHIDEGTKPPSA